MGCDGIKMIEGKVQMRKTLPIPDFDGPVYAPYWEKMEEKQAPLVFHVNDPEEFWDPDRIPDWARTMGWFYGDGTYINNEVQYKQVLNVLKRHPHLKVIFAHFFFLSAQLERLADYLDQFPNMHVDLTPGIEMYFNFALDVDKTRDFFMKYQDRIVFGTDIGAKALLTSPDEGINKTESFSRIHVIRSFLEHEGGFKLENNSGFLFGDPNHQFSGIGLPDDVLEKIYHLNFEKLTGLKPSKIKPEAIAEECKRIIFMLGAMAGFQTGQAVDTSIAEEVKTYFEAHF
jgi:predicted TIM-barrel fold metal-dependent hydrolase